MNSNDETSVPTTSEREAARARLARQIGRLLAHEWLRDRASGESESSAASPLRHVESRHSLPDSQTTLSSDGTDLTPDSLATIE
jgi:hypothetical protein